MNILVGKTFGIGNAVLAVPAIKALASLGTVDVLVGTGPDDRGAFDVMLSLKESHGCIRDIHMDTAIEGPTYDVAVMAIPFDGRWQNGVHFRANRVMDGRKRPDNIERLGFDMWKKHEVEYQMESPIELGFIGRTPSSSFIDLDAIAAPDCCVEVDPNLVYLGIGYKRDPGGFGLSKHFGNGNFVDFMSQVRGIRPDVRFVSTATLRDMFETGIPMMRAMGGHPTYVCYAVGLRDSFRRLAGCRAYFGNDTGMMHVAASLCIPTYGYTPYPDLAVKNPPFGTKASMIVPKGGAIPMRWLAEDFVKFVWGE